MPDFETLDYESTLWRIKSIQSPTMELFFLTPVPATCAIMSRQSNLSSSKSSCWVKSCWGSGRSVSTDGQGKHGVADTNINILWCSMHCTALLKAFLMTTMMVIITHKHILGLMTMLTVDDDGKSSKYVGFYHHCTPFGSSLWKVMDVDGLLVFLVWRK